MTRASRTPRNPANLSASVHKQLHMYAPAARGAGAGVLAFTPPAECVVFAGAALVGLLAFTEPAEARIVYTPANIPIPCHPDSTGGTCHGTLKLDLNHDKRADFRFNAVGKGQDGSIIFRSLRVAPVNSKNEVWASQNKMYAGALPSGVVIRPAANFVKRDMRMCYSSSTTGVVYKGPWWNFSGYLGLRFLIKGKVHYG